MIQTEGPISEDTTGVDADNLFVASQKAINTWSNILAATGGALEPSKTFYIPIIPEQKGKKLTLSTKYSEKKISLENKMGERLHIEQKDPNDAFFTLGIWQSPSGNKERQKKHLIDIIHAWGVSTSTNKLTWQHARIAVQTTIGKTLEYSLTATTFNQQQCREIQKALLHAV